MSFQKKGGTRLRPRQDKRGVVLIGTLIVLVTLTGMTLAFVAMTANEIKSSGAGLNDAKAFYIAEAGLAKARWALTTGAQTVGWGESDTALGDGTYTVTTVDNGDGTYTITSSGYIPDDTTPVVQRRVQEKSVPFSMGSPPNLSLTATASASSVKGGNTADKAQDGDYNTKWQASGTPSAGSPEWLAMDFGSAVSLDRVVFDEPSGNSITVYTLQHSSNGSTWTAVSNPVASVVGQTTTVDFDSTSDRYLRIYITGSTRKDPAINEFESYNIAGGGVPTLGQGKFVTAW